MSGYTKVDNWLFDEVMPRARPNTYKVVSAVIRCTVGWKKECDVISLSQFQSITGIKGRSNIINAIQDAIDCGFITRSESGQSYSYSASHEIGLVESRNVTSTSHEIGLETSHEIGHTKEKVKENNKVKWDDVLSLLDFFTELTHIRQPKLGDDGWDPHQEKWIDPVMDLLGANKYDCGLTRQKMAGAVKVMREKELTIASPKSIYNVALSINGSTSGKVKRTKDGGFYV